MGYYKGMKDLKKAVVKSIYINCGLVQTIEKIAQKEHRSFTKQVEVMLENALKRRDCQPAAAAS